MYDRMLHPTHASLIVCVSFCVCVCVCVRVCVCVCVLCVHPNRVFLTQLFPVWNAREGFDALWGRKSFHFNISVSLYSFIHPFLPTIIIPLTATGLKPFSTGIWLKAGRSVMDSWPVFNVSPCFSHVGQILEFNPPKCTSVFMRLIPVTVFAFRAVRAPSTTVWDWPLNPVGKANVQPT